MYPKSQTIEYQYNFVSPSVCKLGAIHFQLVIILASIFPLGYIIFQILPSRNVLCFHTLWLWADLMSHLGPMKCGKGTMSLDRKRPWLLLHFLLEFCFLHENKLELARWRMSQHVKAELSHARQSHSRLASQQSTYQLTIWASLTEISQLSARSA